MALISCPECGTQVSALAAACPKCAAPIASAGAAKTVGQQVTTTELTSKKFKRTLVIGLLLVVVGIILMFNGGTTGVVGGLTLLTGIVLTLITRVRAWWHHG